MTVAQVIKTSNPNIVYRETDRMVLNLLPALRQYYGLRPIIFWKYDISDPQNWVVSLDENYIFGTKPSGSSPVVIPPTVTDIGPSDRVSKYCGTTGPNSSGVEREYGSRAPVLTFFSLLSGTEKPVIRRRGVITESVPVGGGTAVDAYIFSQNVSLGRNASKEEILSLWNTYLYNARNNKPSESSDLYYINQRTGEREQITTYAQLQYLFPRYFQFDKQFQQEALNSLIHPGYGKKIFVDGQWWDVDTSYLGLWNKFAETGLSDQAITRELIDSGYTMAQINAIRGVKGLTMEELKRQTSGAATDGGGGTGGGGGGTGGGSSNGGGRSANGSVWTGPEGYKEGRIQDITVQRSKNIFFTSDEVSGFLAKKGVSFDNSSPVMYQVYRDATTNAQTGDAIINEYVFDVIPNEINYGNFGGEWVSIDRVGAFPFIDWKSFKLLQISFSFTIADKDGGVFTADGLDISVKTKIEKLQRMAQTPFPVMFYGFDSLLTNQFRYDNEGTPRGIQFVIQDLSISATRRNESMEITRATANITLQEIPIERTSIIGMPRLKHVPKKPDEPVTFTDPEYGLTTDNLNRRPNQDIEYPT